MKKIVLLLTVSFLASAVSYAQIDTTSSVAAAAAAAPPAKPKKKKYDLSKRANDHFLVQFGYASWMNLPDSIKTGSFPRTINAYFMFDFPFKSNQKLSAGLGVGVGSEHLSLDKSQNWANVKATSSTLPFVKPSALEIKKTKLVATYAEVPVELRYVADPENSDRSFKFAIGGKIGTMLKGSSRTRVLQSGADYLLKESSKRYFNTTRIAGTARIGVGHFTLFGSYQFTSFLKEGMGPEIRPFTVGLSFGGL